MSYGAKKVFQNFREAKEFAQALARDGAPHKVTQCEGQWQVEYHSTDNRRRAVSVKRSVLPAMI